MARSLYYPGADRTSRWYPPNVVGVAQETLTKLVLHSTETPPTSGCPGYNSGRAAPTMTIDPWNFREWQHFPMNMSAKALVDPSSTAVRENRDNVAQIEVIGYSQRSINPKFWLPTLDADGLQYIAEVVGWYHLEWDVPMVKPAQRWTWNAASDPLDPRMTSRQYDAYEGVLAHRHVPGNVHWDISINIDAILAKARQWIVPQSDPITSPQEDDMPTPADLWSHEIPNLAAKPDPRTGKYPMARADFVLGQSYRQANFASGTAKAALEALLANSGKLAALSTAVQQMAGGGLDMAAIEAAVRAAVAESIDAIDVVVKGV